MTIIGYSVGESHLDETEVELGIRRQLNMAADLDAPNSDRRSAQSGVTHPCSRDDLPKVKQHSWNGFDLKYSSATADIALIGGTDQLQPFESSKAKPCDEVTLQRVRRKTVRIRTE